MSKRKTSNPFEQLESDKKVPENLKSRVMTTITLAHLIGAFSELFTTNMGKTASHLFNEPKKKKK